MLNLYKNAVKLFQCKLDMPQYAEYLENKNEVALNILWQDCCREIYASKRFDGRRKNLGNKVYSAR